MKNLLSTMYFFLKNYSPEEVAYLLIRCNKTKFFLRNTNNTDRNDLNKQNTQTHTHQTSKEIWHWKGGEGVVQLSAWLLLNFCYFLIVQKKSKQWRHHYFELEIYQYTEISSFLRKYYMLKSRLFHWRYLTFCKK